MDTEKVSAALRELAAEYAGNPRSETARLREVLDDVEAAVAAGASHAAVLEILHARGFTLTASSFESTLARLRKERKAGQGNVQPRNDAGQHADPG
jgi:hypothetical protein